MDREVHQVLMMKEDEVNEMGTVGRWSVTKEEVVVTEEIMEQVFVEQTQVIEMRETTVEEQCWSIDQTGEVVEDQTGEVVVTQEVWISQKPVVEVSEMVEEQWFIEKGEVVTTTDEKVEQGVFMMTTEDVEQVSTNTVVGVVMGERWSVEKGEAIVTEEVGLQEEVFGVQEMVEEHWSSLEKGNGEVNDQVLVEKKQVHVEVNGVVMEERRSVEKGEVIITEEVEQAAVLEKKGVLEVNAIMVSGQLSLGLGNEEVVVGETVSEPRPLGEEVFLNYTKTIYGRWKKQLGQEIADGESEDGIVGNYYMWNTRESCEARVEYEKAVRKYLSHTTHCSKCVEKRQPISVIIIVIIRFILQFVHHLVISSGLTEHRLIRRTWTILEQSYEIVVTRRAYVFIIKKPGVLISRTLSVLKQSYEWVVTMKVYVSVKQILTKILVKKVHPNPPRPLTGVIPSVDHPSTPTGVTPSPPTGVIPSVDHPSTSTGVTPSPPTGVIPSVDHPSTPAGVTPSPPTGVIPSVDHPSTPPGVTPSPPTGVIPSVDHPSTPPGVIPSPPMGVIPSVDHPSTPTGVTPIPTTGVVPSVDHPSTPPGVLISRTLSVLKQSYEWVVTMKVYVSVKQILTKILVKKVHPNPPRPLTGVIPSVDHPSTPPGVIPSPPMGVIPSVDHPSTPTGVTPIPTTGFVPSVDHPSTPPGVIPSPPTGVLISRTLSVLKQSYEWVVTMKVYVSVKQILTKILVKKVHPNPPRPLTGVIPSVDHPSTPTGVTPSPLTGVIPSVDHPSTPTGVNTIITEHVPKQSYESVVVVVTRLYVFLHKKQELLYKLLLKLWMEVTNNPSRRLFLFGVFSVLLCLIGTQFMVNQDYQIASVDHPSTTTGVTPSPPTGVIPSVDHPSTPPGVIPSPPMGVIPSVDHPSTPTGVTPIPTMGVVPSVDHPSTPPGVTPSPPTGVIPSGDHPSTPTGVTPSPPTGVIPSIDHPSTPTDVETWIQINKVNFIAGISILLYIAIRKLPTTSSRIVMVVRTKLQLVLWTTIHVTTRVQTELLRIWLAIKLVKVLNVCKVLVQAATKLLQWFRDFVSKEEILKSIVYGGLTEIIASISVVAFFSDFDTTILNVIAFALAGLIGGCFFFVTNIWGLKKGGGNSYTEQLGRVNYFPFHATLATLSFIIFGMIPPSTFVFSFIKTNDKKLAIWVVSAVSLLCLSLLAIFKAYVITSITYRFKYVRTVLWYQVIALGVSICSYLASKMVKGSIEDIGLFNTSTCDAMSMSRHN